MARPATTLHAGAHGKMKERMKVRPDHVALAVALIFFIVVAATRLNSTSLWADEAWSLAATNDLGLSLRSTHGTMGLYYSLLWLWAHVSSSTVWLRLLSTLCAVGTIIVTQSIARRVGGARLAVVAPLVLVTSPMFMWTGTEARGYALETLITACCWYAAIRIFARHESPVGRRRWQTALVFLALLGPFTHGLFIVQLMAIGAWSLVHPARAKWTIKLAPALLVSMLATLFLVMAGLYNAGAVVNATAYRIFLNMLSWYVAGIQPVALVGLGFMTIGAVVSVQAYRRSRSKSAAAFRLVPMVWVLAPFTLLVAIRLFHGVWAPYYATPTAPGIALLLGAGIVAVTTIGTREASPNPTRGKTGVFAVSAILILCLAVALVARPMHPVQEWRAAAQLVADEALPGDAIIFGTAEPDMPVAARPGFEAAWRETDHDTTPVSIAPDRPLGKVLRVDPYPSSDELRRTSLEYDRIWAVDYRNQFANQNIVNQPPFVDRFHLEKRYEFAGEIVVELYESDP